MSTSEKAAPRPLSERLVGLRSFVSRHETWLAAFDAWQRDGEQGPPPPYPSPSEGAA